MEAMSAQNLSERIVNIFRARYAKIKDDVKNINEFLLVR